ncbi:MAG TPA: M23 family metallopeptidase [Brevefilum fermentans]|jgi:murein DD-endopeptidase MepM/ murein hydrolase activator NlpD|uniref:M23ase beta-sheet core domain-containing protein n=1 Tax=Candidatus Brevifilum fermentans TaxID=1986204 RepID=A0A1Y6K4E6_9CHLR|nr:M23 family metallopeptidase [Brevefilum fermentans]OQB84760.1 MAG: Murein DD-endopeptidase MepM [Chloroflexi bacterium ADurb.Bin120]SMX53727.1 exported protein of unknown function [Brevefilum fermentans]HOM67768.1 M23 family metallopeptidase [Brevefilum fermentans]HPX96283.1 M23 family metallopeptidase [Brevefilum fermentans]HQA29609.1 M23 family metallopeptidase [Brevefilum fermentans]
MPKSISLAFIGILVIIAACQPVRSQVEQTLSPLPTPTDRVTEIPNETSVDVEFSVEKPTPQATMPAATKEPESENDQWACEEDFCLVDWPGWLERPIGEGATRTIDRSYPYGSRGDGSLDLHYGVEFLNSYGTPVLAAQAGEVVFAGTDDTIKLGPFYAYYGNTIVVLHPGLAGIDREVYTLYAHLSEIGVAEGDTVAAGDEIGRVGASGAAYGPHLHFEVRVGANDYTDAVNPVLWFAPLDDHDHPKTATLAGVILDRGGTPLPKFSLTLEKRSLTGEVENYYYPKTYFPTGLNAHFLLDENFAVPDIPAGEYRLAFIAERMYEYYFSLEPGCMGFIKIQLD